MVRADLHVHSKYSEHPSEWFLQRLGANESYIEPETVYRLAKERGMDFVTLTDHNRIEGAQRLQAAHPEDVFLSVEATTYFPENGCKIHLLVYGLNESQFQDIQKCRTNIYELRDYLKAEGLAHALAHATYSENGKLDLEILEKLILLFDVFEGVNGSRNRLNNLGWTRVLSQLTPEHIERLVRRYRIEPFSATPWIKGLTGGSDDHAGLFIARTHTAAEARTIPEFLDQIKRKRTCAHGRQNDYQSFAFTLYKIACDFSKSKSRQESGTLLSALHDLVFENKTLGLKNHLRLGSLRLSKEARADGIMRQVVELADVLRADAEAPIEDKLRVAHDKLADISDEFFKLLLRSAERDLKDGDLLSLIRNFSASLPGIFLSLPFFSTLRHMHNSRGLIEQLHRRFGVEPAAESKRVLWFTDTLLDANGVSSALQALARAAGRRTLELHWVTSLTQAEGRRELPANVVNLPSLHRFEAPSGQGFSLKIPSLLRSLQIIHDLEPDEIIISTPGPVGLLGLLAGKLLQIKKTGIYHTDFTRHAQAALQDEAASRLVEAGQRWFYSAMDEIRVPSEAYRAILEERGYEADRLKRFPAGVDLTEFSPRLCGRRFIEQKYQVPPGVTLLYVGRIAPEKNLEFLADLYRRVGSGMDEINLVVIGDGPGLAALKSALPPSERVHYLGAVERRFLPEFYSAADLLVFPGTCEAGGMAVLEAQACGLPVLVSDAGGPREFIVEDVTGFTAKALDPEDWTWHLMRIVNRIRREPEVFAQMRRAARENCVRRFGADKALQELFGLEQGAGLAGGVRGRRLAAAAV